MTYEPMKLYMITNHMATPEYRFRQLYPHPALALAAFKVELLHYFGVTHEWINEASEGGHDQFLDDFNEQFGPDRYDFEMIEFIL